MTSIPPLAREAIEHARRRDFDKALASARKALEQICLEHDSRVAVVGHSRGGMLARVLGVRRPDLVETVVAMGSPLHGTLGELTPMLRRQIDLMLALLSFSPV